MKLYSKGAWRGGDESIEVINPFDGQIVDTVPRATAQDVEEAIESAQRGAGDMKSLTGYERFEILSRATALLRQRADEIARTLSLEEGKPLAEALFEVDRSAQTLELSGEEAKRLSGEVLPLDGGKGVKNKLGFTLRVPCGVIAAIAPFNFPLNLVCHKVGPAIAAGNSVILKPASDTPLVSLKLVEILLEAGLPPLGISCLTGSGSLIGEKICSDPRVRKISFTGSKEVGERICAVAGIKKVTMELGSNCPLVVLPDADLDEVANLAVSSAYTNAGQVCISAQRLIVMESVREALIETMKPKVEALKVGDQLLEETGIGPMVRKSDASRVESWIQEAVGDGAQLVCGGERDGALMQPTLLDVATPDMRVCREELFGPAVSVMSVSSIDEAIRLANDTEFGLSAGLFTKDIDAAMRFAREVDSGNIHINWGPLWRTDAMPYGGMKGSGMGKEGPKYAIEEMTEMKSVVIHSK
ncbi:aldehyde dehydrogenase family protein [Candidatus Pelagisphaera phototrophica]|uniref:aldehyde dehydrogenase family protein n=1 Tax=Candidatus Pelagisphaera phototrophica TaxID=2684113 RepID=UPI001A0FA034|nr:aldehyde dehydrogenase family protein [Candidatus Pelagisphaera phototrophica]QXD31355.1 aldehyde dehydrogenase family protein [Candidatus Pelagisphaera phototrophica]